MSASADQHELRVHNQTEIDIQSLVLLRNMSSRIYFMLVAIFTVAAVFQFSGQVSGAQHCGMNTNVLGQLVSQCEKYVLKSGPKIRPSPGCCAVVKKVVAKSRRKIFHFSSKTYSIIYGNYLLVMLMVFYTKQYFQTQVIHNAKNKVNIFSIPTENIKITKFINTYVIYHHPKLYLHHQLSIYKREIKDVKNISNNKMNK